MFESNFHIALLLTLLAGLSTGIGGVIVLFKKKLDGKFLSVSMGFSAGVMIFISLVELFNESRISLSQIYGDQRGFIFTLLSFFGGIAIITVIDLLVPSAENPHEMNFSQINTEAETSESRNSFMRMGLLTALAITIHNFPEGIATFISAMEDPAMGTSIALAIAIHNIPEGIAVAVPIYFATKSRSKAMGYSFLSGLAEPLGGLIGYFLLASLLSESMMGIILAAVAGIMVFISFDELLPAAEKYGKHHIAIIGVITGMLFMGVSMILF